MLTIHLDATALDRAQQLLRRFPALLKEALKKANVQSAGHVLTRMKQVHLVGGNPLNRRTGNLIRSWAVIKPVDVGDGWRGGVGSNCEYAAAHEFGVDKTQNVAVRAHVRAEHRRDTFKKSASNYRRGGTGVVLNTAGIAFVSAFSRAQHTKLPARPYARPSFMETEERIRATHHDQIRQAWEKAK